MERFCYGPSYCCHHCSLSLWAPQAVINDSLPGHSAATTNRTWSFSPRAGCWAGDLAGRWSGYRTSTTDLLVLACCQYPVVASIQNTTARWEGQPRSLSHRCRSESCPGTSRLSGDLSRQLETGPSWLAAPGTAWSQGGEEAPGVPPDEARRWSGYRVLRAQSMTAHPDSAEGKPLECAGHAGPDSESCPRPRELGSLKKKSLT